MQTTAVCLVSGGLDSCVAAAIAHSRGLRLAFLHVSYGQLTEARERKAFQDIADYFGVTCRMAVEIEHLKRIGHSALTDPNLELPQGDLNRAAIPASYVPFRNANLLAVATSWAEAVHAPFIYMGAVEEDSSGYPDCRESFFEAYSKVIREGTRPETKIEIVTPLIHLRKKVIIEMGLQLEAPLHLTWSCYREAEVPCGQCDSCLLRRRGFQEAAIEDPLGSLQESYGRR